MGDTGDQPCTAQGSSVIRMRQGTVPRRQAPRDGVLALAFHTLLSFQGTSPGRSSATHLRFPGVVTAGAAGTVPRAFQDRQRLPTCPASVLLGEHHPPCRHLHTEAPPCAPTYWASGRPPNSRRIESSWRSATSCLPVPAPRASAGEVLGLEELPCLQLGEGSTGFDSVSTSCHRLETSNHNGSSGCSQCNGRDRAGIPGRSGTRGRPGGPGAAQDAGAWRRTGARRPTVSRCPSSSSGGQVWSMEPTGRPSSRTAPWLTRRLASPREPTRPASASRATTQTRPSLTALAGISWDVAEPGSAPLPARWRTPVSKAASAAAAASGPW